MKKLLTLIAVAAMLALPAFAKTYKLPKEGPIAQITIPDTWKVEAEDESLSITSSDDEIEISIEVNDAESLEGAIQETIGYLKKNKVTIDKATEKKSDSKTDFGAPVTDYSWKGKDEEGPTNIGLTIINMTEKKMLLIMFWGNDKATEKHGEDLMKIITSLKKP